MLVTVCLVVITLLEMCQLTESIGAKFSRLLTVFCSLLICLPSVLAYLPNFEYPNWFSAEPVIFLVLLLIFCKKKKIFLGLDKLDKERKYCERFLNS